MYYSNHVNPLPASFSGLSEEDPEEYIEAVERYVRERHGGRDAAALKNEKRTLFRKGLCGLAEQEWYFGLSAQARGDWDTLIALFRIEFPYRSEYTLQALEETVSSFKRGENEHIGLFFVRAEGIAKRCNHEQSLRMRNALYHGISRTDDRERFVLWLTITYLDEHGKLDDCTGLFNDECTFFDVKNTLEKTARLVFEKRNGALAFVTSPSGADADTGVSS